jgi:hypothetical protein
MDEIGQQLAQLPAETPADPNSKWTRHYLQAYSDVNTFLSIRKGWDEFLTTDPALGSTIPPGWVSPPQPCNNE